MAVEVWLVVRLLVDVKVGGEAFRSQVRSDGEEFFRTSRDTFYLPHMTNFVSCDITRILSSHGNVNLEVHV